MDETHTTCPACRSDDLLVVVLSPAGTPMRFATCRHCEHRWWHDEHVGEPVDLGTVIEHISA
jgi:DNA-directed RNA polymerase subunit M/transcription elongation factor TFIIS